MIQNHKPSFDVLKEEGELTIVDVKLGKILLQFKLYLFENGLFKTCLYCRHIALKENIQRLAAQGDPDFLRQCLNCWPPTTSSKSSDTK